MPKHARSSTLRRRGVRSGKPAFPLTAESHHTVAGRRREPCAPSRSFVPCRPAIPETCDSVDAHRRRAPPLRFGLGAVVPEAPVGGIFERHNVERAAGGGAGGGP